MSVLWKKWVSFSDGRTRFSAISPKFLLISAIVSTLTKLAPFSSCLRWKNVEKLGLQPEYSVWRNRVFELSFCKDQTVRRLSCRKKHVCSDKLRQIGWSLLGSQISTAKKTIKKNLGSQTKILDFQRKVSGKFVQTALYVYSWTFSEKIKWRRLQISNFLFGFRVDSFRNLSKNF